MISGCNATMSITMKLISICNGFMKKHSTCFVYQIIRDMVSKQTASTCDSEMF